MAPLNAILLTLVLSTAVGAARAQGCDEANHEYWDSCGSMCPSTCQDVSASKPCTLACNPNCFCKDGYTRDLGSGKCIPTSQCPRK